jgi:hypothetical protein
VEIKSSDYGDSLRIWRWPRPGERTLLRRRMKVEVSEHILDRPLVDLVVVMAQYAAAARHGSPVEPPTVYPWVHSDEAAQEMLIVVDRSADPADYWEHPAGADWEGRIHVLGGTLDPASGTGLHQLDLEPMLEGLPITDYVFPQTILGEATVGAIDALAGRYVEPIESKGERAIRLVLRLGPVVIGFVMVSVVVRFCV